MLEISDLHVNYRGVTAVERVSLAVGTGEFVVLLGSNGAGKSSLLQAVMGLAKSEGRVQLGGDDISRIKPHSAARLGVRYVPEGGGVLAGLTVEDNLTLGIAESGGKARATAIEAAVEMFPPLGRRLRSHGGELSGGERQMVALARAMNAAPRLLLLDEPSLGLAPIIVDQVYERLATARQRGMAILLAEQNARNALAACDRGYVMQRGRLVASGTGEELNADQEMVSFYLS